MKRVNDYFVPSVSEIKRAIQHYNRLNRSRFNFCGDGCVRFRFWRLYWLPCYGEFRWEEYADVGSYTVFSCDHIEITPKWCDTPESIREFIFNWATMPY